MRQSRRFRRKDLAEVEAGYELLRHKEGWCRGSSDCVRCRRDRAGGTRFPVILLRRSDTRSSKLPVRVVVSFMYCVAPDVSLMAS